MSSSERNGEAEWSGDRRTADNAWRRRMESDVAEIRRQLNEVLKIKEQFVGVLKVSVGLGTIIAGSAAFVLVIIQIIKATIHGL